MSTESRPPMQLWLKLLLITMTVGGGFAGINLSFGSFDTGSLGPKRLLLWFLLFAMYAFVFVSGLLFIRNERNTLPLYIALALQVPWLTTNFLIYHFMSALDLVLEVGARESGGVFAGFNARFGSFSRIGGDGHPFRIGVNVVALALIYFLARTEREEPALDPLPDQSVART